MFDSTFSLSGSTLSPQKELEVANILLENARKTNDPEIALKFCTDAEAALSRMKRAAKKTLASPQSGVDQTLRDGVASVYLEHGELLNNLGYSELAQTSYKKAAKWGHVQDVDQRSPASSRPGSNKTSSIHRALASPVSLSVTPRFSSPSGSSNLHHSDIAQIPSGIFDRDVIPARTKYALPNAGARLASASQLAYCLSLLPSASLSLELLDEAERAWSQAKANDEDEQERLHTLAANLTKAFVNDVIKSPPIVAEVACLAPVLNRELFRKLLMNFIDGINQATLLELHLLEGLAQLMQRASPEYLDADDLVKILQVLSTRLKDTHQQSTQHIYKLTLAVSHVLDAMADCHVKDLNREQLHEPLSDYLNGLKGSPDPYLVYQAAYAFQALQYVPDDESPLQATLRRARKVVKGISGAVSAVKGLDVNGFIDGLGHLQDGLVEVYQVAKIGYDGAKALVESGQDFLDCLKEGLSFAKKRTWYPALRGIDSLLRDGQLAKVKKLICEAPHRRDLAFQWGVCQRLGEIAANPDWDPATRWSAVDFLGELYKNDAEWGQQAIVKQWILNILEQLASTSGSALQSAKALLQELGTDGDAKKQGLYQAYREKPQRQYPLVVSVPMLPSPSLLDRVQNKPDIEADLRQLKERRLKQRGDAVYIPPQAKASLQASDDTLFPLMDKVKEFLGSNQKVMLLLGDSGAGKSTFNRALECDLWDAYKKKEGRIPLFINLAAIDKPEQDLIAKQLRKAEFTEPQIRELKGYRRFILICDGYDESQQTHNLYTSNRLNQPGEWSAQMVISCRSEYLGLDYRDRFQPADRNHQAEPALFQEAVIAPFSVGQVQDYIKKYVAAKEPLWQATDYLQALDKIPNLQDLVKNPFMLTLSLEVLPRMIDPGQDISAVRVTRVALYDQFVEQWLERGKKRLGGKDLSPQARAGFERLNDEGFTQNGMEFLKGLASAIYKYQAGNPMVAYSHKRDRETWKEQFFSREDENQLLLEACPLTRNGNQYRFIHKSLLEYCIARAIFEPQEARKNLGGAHTPARRGSAGSVWSFEIQGGLENVTATTEERQPVELTSPLVWRNFVGEPSVLQFLEERVQQEPLFKKQLHALIECSKTDKKWRVAAANAITILVRAGIRFNGADLKGIQVPGADLSYGEFDSAQLQGADLRKANLRGIWLRQANLSSAQMAGVQFGEWPYLKENDEVQSCAYSPDGNTCAVGVRDGTISVYDTTTWTKTHTLRGHTDFVRSVVYSPSGQQIASCSRDRTVRLWDAQTGAPGLILSGHTEYIWDVAYSPNGQQIASCSVDDTVRLWDVQTGAPGPILSGHTGSVWGVEYSPSGQQIASCSGDKTVRLWDAQTGAPGLILTGHTEIVWSVVYSPSGQQIASCSRDKTVRLWDAQTGTPGSILSGHTKSVWGVKYSPSGRQIASCSGDKTVRLWDAQTGAPGSILTGHTECVLGVAYSPNGQQIASCSVDETVRLWDAQTGAPGSILGGHTQSVWGVTYSPNGQQISSCSVDDTVRLWDAQTGAPGPILSGHTDSVTSVAYSPSGQQIASCSTDSTVRLWDVQTGAPGPILCGHTNGVNSAAYSPSGQQIASCSRDKTVRMWDAQTGAPGLILSGHTNGVNSVAYSPSGQQIASCSRDRTVRMWDAQTGAPGSILSGHTKSVWCVAYSPNGQQIASCSADKTVRMWDAQTGAPGLILSDHTNGVNSVAYSPSGRQIASSSDDNTVRLWDAQTGAPGLILSGHTGSVWYVEYSPSGQQIASCSRDKTVRLWDAQTGAPGLILSGHTESVWGVAYSPSGQQIASCSTDKTMRLWDAQTGASGLILSGHTGSVWGVEYSPSGQQIASYSYDKTVRLWDAETGAPGPILSDHTNGVNSVAYSPSGQQIASCSGDKTVRLWDTQTGTPGSILGGHTDIVRSVVYSPSGQQIASCSHDRTVRLWDAQTGAPGSILSGHTESVWGVAYSPNGQQLASYSEDKTVRLWDAQTGAPGPILSGHTDSVTSVAYSPSGQQIASCSRDKTVWLWDVNSGQCLALVEGFHGIVTCITWSATPNGPCFVTGCGDMSVRLWRVAEEEDHFQVRLQWSSVQGALVVSNASIQNAQGLNKINMRLLEQRGAVGKPIPPLSFREASRKLISMVSVASKLKLPSNHDTVDTFLTTDSPAVQSA